MRLRTREKGRWQAIVHEDGQQALPQHPHARAATRRALRPVLVAARAPTGVGRVVEALAHGGEEQAEQHTH